MVVPIRLPVDRWVGNTSFVPVPMRSLTRQMNVRFEERLAERTRIAQELHDTLLQGFLSASMQLHVADDRLPENSPVKPMVSRVLTLMKDVIEDGRNSCAAFVREATNCAILLRHFAASGGVEPSAANRLPGDCGGPAPTLHPVIRDDVYRIGREALVNSFRHAQASSIEVEIEYGANQLRVNVRDNGIGIDPQVLRTGREGHWAFGHANGLRELVPS
jgi:signal transduction histidine kinase